MKSLLFSLLIFAGIASTAFSALHINMPFGLREWWERNTQATHVSIASFGDIPWGKKISGRVGLADPINACSFLKLNEKVNYVPTILIAMRGECPFYLKAHYAQLAGAKMLLIVDNQYEEVELKLMVDSAGQGESIHIPSVLLARQGGEKIIESLKNPSSQVNNIIAGFDFEIPKDDKVEYHLWLTSSNTQSFRFLRDWKKYAETLSHDVTSKIHFGHFRTFGNDASNIDNCICEGRYCSTDPDADLPNTGADVVQEDLRQLCLIKQYNEDAWWRYIMEYRDSCLSGGDMKECSIQTLKKINIDPEDIDWCVQHSYVNGNSKKCESNRLLDQEEAAQEADGTFMFPSVVINKFIYRGNLVPAKGVFEAVCEGFNSMPEACNTHFEAAVEPLVVSTNHWPVVLTALIFLVVFSLFVFCCYKRYISNQLYKQGIREVNMAVSQYIAFKDNEADKEEAD